MSLAAECARQLRHSTGGRPPQRRRGRRNRHPYAPAVRADGAPINFRRASELWSGIVDRRDDEYGPDTVVASVALSCESPGRPAPPSGRPPRNGASHVAATGASRDRPPAASVLRQFASHPPSPTRENTAPLVGCRRALDETRLRRWPCVDARDDARMPSAARRCVGGRRPDAGPGGPLHRRGVRPISRCGLQPSRGMGRRHEGLLRLAHPRAGIRRNHPGSRDRVRNCPLSGCRRSPPHESQTRSPRAITSRWERWPWRRPGAQPRNRTWFTGREIPGSGRRTDAFMAPKGVVTAPVPMPMIRANTAEKASMSSVPGSASGLV